MINSIKYSDAVKAIVFDEPIPEYYNLLIKARTDKKNPLRKNYTVDSLSRCHFMVIFCVNNKPAHLFGLENLNVPGVARAMFRMYSDIAYKGSVNMKLIFNFHQRWPLHKQYNIDTLFFTRNYNEYKTKWFDLTLKKCEATYWKRISTPLIYNNVLQDVYVWGDETRVTALPLMLSGPSNSSII